MSTRASIIIKDDTDQLIFYRHSDGYPDVTGADLKAFVQDYASGKMRKNVPQSAGWLIVRGHKEYLGSPFTGKPLDAGYTGWKCGAYEPNTALTCDSEYIYIIDLDKGTLECRVPNGAEYWDSPTLGNTRACKEFKTVRFHLEAIA